MRTNVALSFKQIISFGVHIIFFLANDNEFYHDIESLLTKLQNMLIQEGSSWLTHIFFILDGSPLKILIIRTNVERIIARASILLFVQRIVTDSLFLFLFPTYVPLRAVRGNGEPLLLARLPNMLIREGSPVRLSEINVIFASSLQISNVQTSVASLVLTNHSNSVYTALSLFAYQEILAIPDWQNQSRACWIEIIKYITRTANLTWDQNK